MKQQMLKVSILFSENMVLQRNKQIPVWGTGAEGKKVVVSLLGSEASAVVTDGKWQVVLPAKEACTGAVMTIQCEAERIQIKNVSIGEVWLAGGQSNMEFYLRYDAEHDDAVEMGENAEIFYFDYPKVSYLGQIEENDYSNFGFWRPCTKENMDYYSAAAYYFAAVLQKKYKVPVGIVGCNWGGTTAACWMGREYLEDNEGKIWLEEYEDAVQNLDMEKYDAAFAKNPLSYTGRPFRKPEDEMLLRGMPKEQILAMIPGFEKIKDTLLPPVGPKSPWRPCGLYHSMLKQVSPYGIRGVIWYQGESDDIHATVYDTVLTNMIRCWRNLWQEELPFLMVQIAPLKWWFAGTPETYPIIRQKQEQVAKHVPNVWMTTTGDVGLEYDVHPKKKKPVGERLALLAMGHIYGEDILCDPPECVGIQVEDGKARLRFAFADGGLIVKGERVNAMECLKNGAAMASCSIVAEGDELILIDGGITAEDHLEVRFACDPYYEVNVFNQAGIPVRPFKISSKKDV